MWTSHPILWCIYEQCGSCHPWLYELLVDLDNIASHSDYLLTEKSASKGQGEQLHWFSFIPIINTIMVYESVSILSSFKSHWHSKEIDVLTTIAHQSYQTGKDTTNIIFIEWGNLKKNFKSLPKRTLSVICLTNAMCKHKGLLFKLISTHTFNIHSTNTHACCGSDTVLYIIPLSCLWAEDNFSS